MMPKIGLVGDTGQIELSDFMKVTKRRLPEVKVPILIMGSRNDSTNSPKGVNILYKSISTSEAENQIIGLKKPNMKSSLIVSEKIQLDNGNYLAWEGRGCVFGWSNHPNTHPR